MDSQKKWLAAYLYYSGNWEQFLINAVKPFVEEVLKAKLADQYFFIRYWERGPHIRLRFKGDNDILENKIRPKLIQYFEKYYQANPSIRQEPEYPVDLSDEKKWFPNNSIQFVEYEPETERYGGPAGILIAEQQFQSCSNTILEIITESEEWSYDRSLGAAIQLHLGFGYAMGMNLHEMQHFYSHIFDSWFHKAYYGHEQNISGEELKNRQEKILTAFKETFEKQKVALIPFHQTLYDALENKTDFEQAWLNNWILDMTHIKKELEKIQSARLLVLPDWLKVNTDIKVTGNHQQLWYLYNSYVHMVNNRLGILNRDEAYLGYLIVNSLKNIKQ